MNPIQILLLLLLGIFCVLFLRSPKNPRLAFRFGKVTLLTKTIRFGAFRGALVLGSKSFKIDAGKSATVKVKLIKRANKLAKRKKLVVNARIVSNGMSDKTTKVTLKF